ncbi:MAG: CHASE2 domain-containing protein, partial [Vicinamibacterales bacterium]
MSATTRRGLLGKIGIGAAIAAAATLVAWGLARTPFSDRAELTTYDWRIRATAKPSAPSGDIVLVSIDDDSVRRMAPLVGRWPWPRLAHATLIDFLARGPAKLVVYDVLFTEPDAGRFTVGDEEWTGAESDQALADAITRSGNVVLAADAAADELLDTSKALQVPLDGIASLNQPYDAGECVERRPLVIPPIEILAKAARFIGHSFMVLDPDGPARRMTPFVRIGERDVPSLSVVAALGVHNLDASAVRPSPGHLAIGGPPIPLVEQTIPDFYEAPSRACRVLIAFRGPSLTATGIPTFNGYSFYDLFRSEIQIQQGEKPDVDPAYFKDRIVVVGASASGTYDVFSTPFGLPAPGAEIHANAIDALLHARTLRPLAMVPGGVAGTFAGALAVGIAGAVVS